MNTCFNTTVGDVHFALGANSSRCVIVTGIGRISGARFNNKVSIIEANVVCGVILQFLITPTRIAFRASVASLHIPIVGIEAALIELITPYHFIFCCRRRWRIIEIPTLGGVVVATTTAADNDDRRY